jgi:hypothetical protein
VLVAEVVTATDGDGLRAQLTLRRGAIRYFGTPVGNDTLQIDQTLTGGIWTATVQALGKTTGHWTFNAVGDDPAAVHVGDILDGERLNDENDSNGYVLRLNRGERLLISVAPVDSPDLNLDAKVYKANGFLAAKLKAVGARREVFGPFAAGVYVVTVGSNDHSSGDYSLSIGRRAQTSTPTFTVPVAGTDVVVPDVVGQTEAQADAALLHAGLAPQAIPVCSHSVPQGIVRQVVRYEAGQETIIVDLDGVKPGHTRLPAGTALVVKVGNGTPCS